MASVVTDNRVLFLKQHNALTKTTVHSCDASERITQPLNWFSKITQRLYHILAVRMDTLTCYQRVLYSIMFNFFILHYIIYFKKRGN